MRPLAVVVLLFPVLALLSPKEAVAGPPEGMSGAMKLDKVEDGLRQYRKAKSPVVRLRWLEKLAPTRDPRVAVALGEALDNFENQPDVGNAAVRAILRYYTDETSPNRWWRWNKADLRRQAQHLSR
jgi:hypothetical protein